MATCGPDLSSSPAWKSRPNCGLTPRVEKKLGVTCTAETLSGSPALRSVKPSLLNPASDSKVLDCDRQSRKSGYEAFQVLVASGSGTFRKRTSPRVISRSGCE